MLAKERNVGIVQIGLNRLDRNIMVKKNVKQDLEFIKEIRQRLCTVDNIVNVCSCSGSYIPEDVINLLLDVGY